MIPHARAGVDRKPVFGSPPPIISIGDGDNCGTPFCPIGCTNGRYTVPADSQITVFTYSFPGVGEVGKCWNDGNGIISGQKYKVDVDITYQVNIGGVYSEKHSTGTIYLTSE